MCTQAWQAAHACLVLHACRFQLGVRSRFSSLAHQDPHLHWSPSSGMTRGGSNAYRVLSYYIMHIPAPAPVSFSPPFQPQSGHPLRRFVQLGNPGSRNAAALASMLVRSFFALIFVIRQVLCKVAARDQGESGRVKGFPISVRVSLSLSVKKHWKRSVKAECH